MLVQGSLNGAGEWVEPQSLAREIEIAMVAAGVLDVDAETEEASTERRRTFIAIATGIVTHFRSNAAVNIPAGALGTFGNVGAQNPAAAVTLTGRIA